MINALSINVEDIFQAVGNPRRMDLKSQDIERISGQIEKVLKTLDTLQTKATFFVIGTIAEAVPALIKRIDVGGHEIASMGYQYREIYKHTPVSFREDLKKSVSLLKGMTGKPVVGYRAPGFSITRETMWAIDILVKNRIKYDCSIFPIRHPRYGILTAPRIPYRIRPELVEFSPSTIRFLGENFPVAGGAYFRILPYSFIKKAIESLNNKGIAANSYLHVWEIDPQQPKLKIPFKRRFTHYAGIKTTQERFERLLVDFQYAPISQVIENERF